MTDSTDNNLAARPAPSAVFGSTPEPTPEKGPEVALFVTCLADLMRPSVARASLELLEAAGCTVTIPAHQSCCGQPGYNSGDYAGAMAIARQVIETFEPYPYTVLPSGSCAGMLVEHYPRLFDGEWRERATRFAARVHELTSFLSDVCDYQPPATGSGAVAYHDSCAGLRELSVRDQPRSLLRHAGVEVRELKQSEVCCGFGGTFCAKMPDLSAAMADEKLKDLADSGADTLVGGDLGCLLALAGRARRRDLPLHFRHVAEVLVQDADTPPIGESPTS